MTFALLAMLAAQSGGWQADPNFLAELEAKKTAWRFRESDIGPYTLPDVLRGTTTVAEWQRVGRPETLNLFRDHVYGHTPDTPATTFVVKDSADTPDGTATRTCVTITCEGGGKRFAFDAELTIPKQPAGPRPAMVFINHRGPTDPAKKPAAPDTGFWPVEQIVARGYAAVTFNANDVDLDKAGDAARAAGVRHVWPGEGPSPWATIGAWAWGASRVMDYLQIDPRIDGKRVAVVGHSRGGKTALWCGAQDERFALVVANGSGRGGASLHRRRFGEGTERIAKSFPHWFAAKYATYGNNEDALPVDQHQLIACVAPRAVYVASADRDLWADPHGEFLSLAYAGPVFALFGQPTFKPTEMPPLDVPVTRGHLTYHVQPGPHALTLAGWMRFLDVIDGMKP